MNIDVREYLRINPISVHDLTLSNQDTDCFLWFSQDGSYQVFTQKKVFDCLYKTIFGELLDDNMEFKADVHLDDDTGTPIIIWDESTHIPEGQFNNYVTREEWEEFKERMDGALASLEDDVDGRIQILRRNGVLNYAGAVELQSRLTEVGNIYGDFLHGLGLMWCYDASGRIKLDNQSERAELDFPLSHAHNDTKAETTTSSFATKAGGGDLVGDFTIGGKMMVSNGNRYGRSLGYNMGMMDANSEQQNVLTYPLGGQNVIDWRSRRRTHNNMPPVTDIWIRCKEYMAGDEANLPTTRFGEAISEQQTQIDDNDIVAGSMTRECIIEAQYDSKTVPELESYGKSNMTEHDFLLRLQLDKDTGDVQLRKQTVDMLLTIFQEDGKNRYGKTFKVGNEQILVSMGDILGQRLAEEFVPKTEFTYWCQSMDDGLRRIQSKIKVVFELIRAAKPLTYVGRIIVSTTDDIEMKVIEHYGGKKWRRMVNFLRGVGSGDSPGRKWGEEYVCLRESNVPLHQHDIQLKNPSGDRPSTTGDAYWMCADKGGVETRMLDKKRAPQDAGVPSAKNTEVEYQISPLEYISKQTPTIPHDNLPPYKEVYIWECVEITDDEKRLLEERLVVSWDSHGGERVSDRLYVRGDTIGSLPPTTRGGYDFDGWFTEPDGGTKVDESTVVNESVTYHAHWTQREYEISYNMNGHGGNPGDYGWKTTYKTEDDDYIPTPSPTDPQCDFIGWSPEKLPRGSIGKFTFNAQWRDSSFQVTWNSNGGTPVEPRSVPYGPIGELPSTSQNGHDFDGWWDGQVKVTPDTIIKGDIEFTAQWKEIPYDIEYLNVDEVGGSVSESNWTTYKVSDIPTGGYVPDPASADGYGFVGWQPEKIPPGTTGDFKFNAIWNANQCVMTWNFNYVGSQTVTTTQNYGENLDIVPPTSRTGYRLLGWWTEQIGGTQVGNNTIVNGNATYYAHWQTITYTISYNMGGHGNAPQGAPTFYTIESETIVPPNPEDEEHHVFNGWSPTSIPHGSTENKTFTANWIGREYTLTFMRNDGTTESSSRTRRYGETVGELDTPSRVGHQFLGWWTSPEDGQGTQVNQDDLVAGDATYHAHWQIDTIGDVVSEPCTYDTHFTASNECWWSRQSQHWRTSANKWVGSLYTTGWIAYQQGYTLAQICSRLTVPTNKAGVYHYKPGSTERGFTTDSTLRPLSSSTVVGVGGTGICRITAKPNTLITKIQFSPYVSVTTMYLPYSATNNLDFSGLSPDADKAYSKFKSEIAPRGSGINGILRLGNKFTAKMHLSDGSVVQASATGDSIGKGEGWTSIAVNTKKNTLTFDFSSQLKDKPYNVKTDYIEFLTTGASHKYKLILVNGAIVYRNVKTY